MQPRLDGAGSDVQRSRDLCLGQVEVATQQHDIPAITGQPTDRIDDVIRAKVHVIMCFE
jgi:hypothetical protein